MTDSKKEIARDLIAFGSIPFYVILLARAMVGPYWAFVQQLSIAAIILIIISLFVKKSNYHLSRAIILTVFSTLFYLNTAFTIVAFLVLALMFGSLFYLKTKRSEIINGAVVGIATAAVTYYLAILI